MTPLMLQNETALNSVDIEAIFAIFENDFITNTVLLGGCPIDVKPDKKCRCPFGNGDKPERFWHIITEKEHNNKKKNNPCQDEPEKNRRYSPARAKRIHWIKPILESYADNPDIKIFFEFDGRQPVLFIWHTKLFYIVLVKKLGKTTNFLVTAHLVYQNKYSEFKNRHKRYVKNGIDGLEWI